MTYFLAESTKPHCRVYFKCSIYLYNLKPFGTGASVPASETKVAHPQNSPLNPLNSKL